ncbi:MAG: fibronectin type III domain-containing protein, partial [Planctomycetaceae bacterium]
MSNRSNLSASLSLRGRESARRRRDRELKVESLEPRLALATGLLSTLVSVVRDDQGRSLLAPSTTAEITEGRELAASVRLTRRPDSPILVSFQSLAPLEVGVTDTTLRFTRNNWNQPQAVSLRSLQDNVRDGDSLVPMRMTAAIYVPANDLQAGLRRPQSQATRNMWVESLDSRVTAPATPVTAAYRGTVGGGGTSGRIAGSYDSVTNRGTVTLRTTMPTLKNFRNRVITVGYSLGPDNRAQIESLSGITASQFRWDRTYRELGNDRGLFGTMTVFQPQFGKSATAMMTAAAVPDAVQSLAVAPTGVGSLLLSWNPPAGNATGYTVTMNNGATTTTSTSMPFTGLSTTVPSYAFTVTATNAAGSGPAAAAAFATPQDVASQ